MRVPVRIAEVVRDAVALVVAESGTRRVAIHTDVSADLPIVMGDHVQLQQVLLNLIVNGMDAMANVEASERYLQIRARAELDSEGSAVRIAVVDHGVGFSVGEAERLFQAFYTTKAHGMGLGLAICRSIVESHGGRLWAERNHGPGATLSFRLPAAAAG